MNENLPTPPVETEETKTTSQIEESLDYRDLLSSQIMAEQAKANASKYVMGGLQTSGAAQTGVAQSVLSGIQAGYQNTIAQNMNQFAMTQDIRQADQLAQTQSNALNTATTLLSEPDLTQDEYKYIYDNYYQNMSAEDQATFQFLYDRKGRELGFTADGTTTTPTVSTEVSDYLFNNFEITDNVTAYNQTNLNQSLTLSNSYKPNVGDENNQKYLTSDGTFDLTKFNDTNNFIRWTEGVSRNNEKDGTIIAVEFNNLAQKITISGDIGGGGGTATAFFHFVVYKGKLYRIPQNKATNKVTKRFKFTPK
jgi:hypothetical protein